MGPFSLPVLFYQQHQRFGCLAVMPPTQLTHRTSSPVESTIELTRAMERRQCQPIASEAECAFKEE